MDHNRARISEAPHCNLNLGAGRVSLCGFNERKAGRFPVIEPAERYTASPYFGKHYGTEYELEQYLNIRREDLFENDGPFCFLGRSRFNSAPGASQPAVYNHVVTYYF